MVSPTTLHKQKQTSWSWSDDDNDDGDDDGGGGGDGDGDGGGDDDDDDDYEAAAAAAGADAAHAADAADDDQRVLQRVPPTSWLTRDKTLTKRSQYFLLDDLERPQLGPGPFIDG